MALLLTHAAQLLTLAGPDRARRGAEMRELGLVPDGAVLIAGDRIVAAGPTPEVRRRADAFSATVAEVNCAGCVVSPGLVDSHTHLIFAAPRLDDYERRLGGMSYEQMAAAGGGISTSVAGVRAADECALGAHGARWLGEASAWGATTVEAKSGYGLTLDSELKLLRAAAAAARDTGLEVPRTFLGAHIVPPEFARARADYLALVNDAMLPACTAPGSQAFAPEFADVFCDPAGFSAAESRSVLQAARARGLKLKLHAEQFASSGGVGLGIEFGAVSLDHLDAITPLDARRLGAAPTVATLLPGANLFLGLPWPPARMLIEAGVAVALATDFNPGTCPTIALPVIMSLACSALRMSPAEAWVAVTINGAAALARAHVCGSLAPGKRADLAVFAADDYRAIPYYAGTNLCRGVVRAGRWLPRKSLCD